MKNDTTETRVQTADPDRYRAARLAGEAQSRDLIALYGFHCELARIPETVSEPILGQIRYQWWRERIDAIYQGQFETGPQSLEAIARLIKAYGLPKEEIVRLIDGRARDLDPVPFANIEEARTYALDTSGALLTLAAQISHPGAGGDDLARAGVSWGLTGLARAWPFYHKTMLASLSVEALCGEAEQAYISVREASKTLPDSLLPAMAYVTLVPGFIKRLRAMGEAADQHMVSYPAFFKQLALLRAVARGSV